MVASDDETSFFAFKPWSKPTVTARPSSSAQADGGSPARALAFSPDGSRAAVASADGSVRFWDAAPASRNGR